MTLSRRPLLVAPAKTPPAVLARLSDAIKQVIAQPEVRARLEKVGATPLGNSSAEYGAQIRSEIARMKTLVHERSISLEE